MCLYVRTCVLQWTMRAKHKGVHLSHWTKKAQTCEIVEQKEQTNKSKNITKMCVRAYRIACIARGTIWTNLTTFGTETNAPVFNWHTEQIIETSTSISSIYIRFVLSSRIRVRNKYWIFNLSESSDWCYGQGMPPLSCSQIQTCVCRHKLCIRKSATTRNRDSARTIQQLAHRQGSRFKPFPEVH